MRVELIGSMLIFAYCLLAGRRHIIASITYAVLVVSFAPHDWPYYLAFLAGAHIGRAPSTGGKVLLYAIAATGYLIASIPMTSAVWEWMPAEVPRLAFQSVLGGALIVYAIRFGALAIMLRSRLAQFLGRISYPLYLIHLPVLLSVGCGVFVASIHAGQSRGISAALALLAFLAATLPLAWLFERFVDTKAIQLAKWSISRRSGDPVELAESPGHASIR
jgi:peptidoglycan/LPS O-acetylase OafA/YrhL